MADKDSELRTSRGAPTLFDQVQTSGQLSPEANYELTRGHESQFSKGLRSGAAGLTAGAFAGEALSQEADGDPEFQRSRDIAMETMQRGEMYAPRVRSLRDIDGVGDAVDFAAGAVGQGVMSMAPTLATAAVTRGRGGKLANTRAFAGGSATAYDLEHGEAALNQYADPTLAATDVEDRQAAARMKGAVNAGLEAIVPAGVAGSILRRPTTSFAGNVGRNALTEGLTETAQQATGFAAEKYLDPERELDPWELADAFAAGALTGGSVSAARSGAGIALDTAEQKLAEQQGLNLDPDLGGLATPNPSQEPAALPRPQLPEPEAEPSVSDAFSKAATQAKDFVAETVTRMERAAESASSPGEFLRQVFGDPLENAAEPIVLGDNDPSLAGATTEETIANLEQRDQLRTQRAQEFAAELLKDEATPAAVKERVSAMQDFSDPENQAFVTQTLVSQRAGERTANAVMDFIDMTKDSAKSLKETVAKRMDQAQDRIVKKNLQDTSPTEQAAFNRLVFEGLTDEAKANPEVRQRLPELANTMLAFASRTGDLTPADIKNLSKLQDGLSLFQDPEAMANQLVEYTGVPRDGDSFISKIKRVTNAQQDINKPNSFLFSSLSEEAKDTLRPAQLRQVAKLVDEFSLTDGNKQQADKVMQGLTAAFGSRENAQLVLDYYQQQNRANVKFDESEMLTDGPMSEREGAPAPTYQFADPKAMRPYRAFAGQTTTEGGMRRRVRESTMAGAALRRSSPDGANVEPVSMSQYVRDTGGNAEAEVLRISDDIKKRIAGHEKRKGEDRSQQINQLKGELSLMREAYRQGGADAALDLYEVLRVSEQEKNDTVATDEDIAKMSRLAGAKNARDTRVTFQREDGSKFTLSAESMWKTQGDKEGSGKGENAGKRARRLFADAAAAVMARPEVTKMVTPLADITVDRKLGITAEKRTNPEYRAMVREALKAAEGSISKLQDALDNVVDEFLELGDAGAEGDIRRDEIQDIMQQNIDQLSERLDRSRKNEGPLAGNIAAQAVARQKLRLYRDAQGQIDAIVFDEEFEERDNNRKGIPGSDESGPVGRDMPRTRMNEELGNAGPRFAEEDTGFGVGAERRAPDPKAKAKVEEAKPKVKPRTIADNLVAALHDVAVNGNYDRLDTPEKVVRYAAMAQAALGQLRQIPEGARTDMQTELLAKLEADFKQDGDAAFDWHGLFDGQKATDDQVAMLDAIVKQSAMKPKRGRPKKVSDEDRQKILDEIRRIRGDGVHVAFKTFAEIGGSGEFSMNRNKTDRLIKIATNAANQMGVAWHESLHDFFAMLDENPVSRSIKKDLINASNAPHVKRQLRKLLEKHPEALRQMENDGEERVAYMYQFWAEGELTLGPTGEGIFQRLRKLFNDLFKLVSLDQRAEDLLTALHEGRFAEPSTVAEVLADMQGDRFTNKMDRLSPEINKTVKKVFAAAPDRLRAFQNDKLNELADMFSSESGKMGFIQRRFQQQGKWENKLAAILANTTAQQRRQALENLQAMKKPTSQLEKDLAEFFSEMHDYMSDAGVMTMDSVAKRWVALRKVENYFPRSFDRAAIMKDREGFIKLLRKHSKMSEVQAKAVVAALIHGTGQLELVENEHALGFTPYAPSVQDRRFTFINEKNAAEFAKYQHKDLADITTGYVKQAVHRAEYARMFGNDGAVIVDMISESGITDAKELEEIGKVVQGLEGSIGNEMSSSTKEMMSGVMTLQNVVILPLAIFSQMIDPVVMAARSGNVSDAGKAYMTAIKRLRGQKVDGEELAEMMGIISQDSTLEAMGVAYGAAHMSQSMRNINRTFFKYNGLQGWNNSMRIAATAAGERYLIANRNNTKALDELGLTPKDIKVKEDGRLDVSGQAVQEAMFRFVDEAVLRPSASHRPVWMSDPRFLLVAHLKQFTFAMHNVVLKRANRELANDNPKAWGILALAMPVVLASDLTKFALSGNFPDHWGFMDYLTHAVERSGLLGLGDFGVQAMRGMEYGQAPGEALLGPAGEHLMEILRWIGGDPRTSFEDVFDRTMPGARFF